MKKFSFIHTADLHLDSPFKGISKIDDSISSKLKEATFNAFDAIIDICIKRQVDFIIISGDIYDGADRSLRAQLKFRNGMLKLEKEKIQAYIVHGNHDPLNGWSANLNLPRNVNLFPGNDIGRYTFIKEGKERAEIYGISYLYRDVKENLVNKFSEKRITEDTKNIFTIGILHCNLDNNREHGAYAPCSLQDLKSKNYDYWALGHIHKKKIINRQNPLIVYPGNPQGLNPNEDGEKGCYLVEVNPNNKPTLEFLETDSVQWFKKRVSIEKIKRADELIESIEYVVKEGRQKRDNNLGICRIILEGRGSLYSDIIRKDFIEDILHSLRETNLLEAENVWIASIINNANPEISREALLSREDFIGDLIKYFEKIKSDYEDLNALRESIEPFFSSGMGKTLLPPVEDKDLLELIEKSERLCLDRLVVEQDSNED